MSAASAAFSPRFAGSGFGADVSENMLGHLRRRLKHLPNVRTLAVSGYDLAGLADASVDMAYCTVVFMHLEEWERYRYVREAFRVLRPGGRLLVDNYTLVTDEGWALFEQLLAIKPLERPAQVSKSSTPQEQETYFRRAGFGEIRQELENLWVRTYGVKPSLKAESPRVEPANSQRLGESLSRVGMTCSSGAGRKATECCWPQLCSSLDRQVYWCRRRDRYL